MKLTIEKNQYDGKDARVSAIEWDEQKYPVIVSLQIQDKRSIPFVVNLTTREFFNENGIFATAIKKATFVFTEAELIKTLKNNEGKLSGTITLLTTENATHSMSCSIHLTTKWQFDVRVNSETTTVILYATNGLPLMITQKKRGEAYTAEMLG